MKEHSKGIVHETHSQHVVSEEVTGCQHSVALEGVSRLPLQILNVRWTRILLTLSAKQFRDPQTSTLLC